MRKRKKTTRNRKKRIKKRIKNRIKNRRKRVKISKMKVTLELFSKD